MIKNMLRISALILISASQLYGGDKPKNIIIFIGDGLGLTYVSASVMSLENDAFSKFNSIGLSVTSAANRYITDSGAGATAIATGYRANYYSLSVSTAGKNLRTIMEEGKALGKSTGVVSTSSITHATPGAFVTHLEHRKTELDAAAQFVESGIDVAIGAGYTFFTPYSIGGRRDDGKNLIDELKNKGYNYYQDPEEFLADRKEGKFFAMLDSLSLRHASEREYTLGDLTDAAIEELSRNNDGFILMVEGSQIDWAAHDNMQEYLMAELKDFNSAINTALEFAEEDGNTLVLVTADHETGGGAITGGSKEAPEIKFVTKGHTAAMVGIFSKGPGEELFRGTMDNYMIGRKLFGLINPDYKFDQH